MSKFCPFVTSPAIWCLLALDFVASLFKKSIYCLAQKLCGAGFNGNDFSDPIFVIFHLQTLTGVVGGTGKWALGRVINVFTTTCNFDNRYQSCGHLRLL